MHTKLITTAALMLAVAASANAQDTSTTRIPVHKDVTYTSGGTLGVPNGYTTSTYNPEAFIDTTMTWYTPVGAATCAAVDRSAASAVTIKTDLYNASTMISPDSAKML